MSKRTYAWRNGELVELTPQDIAAIPQVMDDVAEFRSPDGAMIRGRAQWKEHLKRTDSIEMGHSDIKKAEQNWQAKKEKFRDKVASGGNNVREVEPPDGEIRETQRNSLGVEMANRLYNRSVPDRKTMIKLTLETAKYLAKRK